mmetsp:Transcript_5950/g.14403  ORF Transcript_5950/g.14403 Transcript_5950/m.14403 type:complete len:202 (+) Transcript_5950:243-848(+)
MSHETLVCSSISFSCGMIRFSNCCLDSCSSSPFSGAFFFFSLLLCRLGNRLSFVAKVQGGVLSASVIKEFLQIVDIRGKTCFGIKHGHVLLWLLWIFFFWRLFLSVGFVGSIFFAGLWLDCITATLIQRNGGWRVSVQKRSQSGNVIANQCNVVSLQDDPKTRSVLQVTQQTHQISKLVEDQVGFHLVMDGTICQSCFVQK